jgi:oligopeptide transport system substrate-binding protein
MILVRQWRHVLLAVIAVIGLVALAACGDDDDNKASNTPAASSSTGGSASPTATGGAPADMAPDADQSITINPGAEPSSIDPQAQSYTYEATITNNTYIALFGQDPQTSQLTPLAASEVPTTANGGVSADGLTYTIKLKPDLVWSDGTPVVAGDFVYGIMRGYNLNISGSGYGGFIQTLKGAPEVLKLDPTSATYFADIQTGLKDSVVAVDDHTLKLVASAVSVAFPSNFVLPITAAVKKSNVEALGDSFGQAAGASQMITDGPFTITSWTPKDKLTLTRNDKFTAGHKAYLREVNITFIEDTVQAYNALQAGDSDEAAVPPANYPGVKNDPSVHQEQEFGTRWITVDVTLPPWDKKDFVIGINQATDRDTFNQDIYQGLRQSWASPCAAAVYGCDPSIFDNLKFDLTKAKASVLAAYPAGTTIPNITLEGVSDATVQSLIQTLKSEWEAVDSRIHVDLKTVDQATLRSDMKTHISGTQITGWGMDFADATDLWSIKTKDAIGGNNLGFYDRPGYDTLEKQQDTQTDPAARKETLKKLQEFYAADPADITMAVQLRTDQFNPKIKGIVTSPFDYQVIGDQFLPDMYVSK